MTGTRYSWHCLIRRERLLNAIGLLALLCMQISIASHQFEHTSDDIAKTCRICVQQDRADDALPGQIIEIVAIGFCDPDTVFEPKEIGIECLSSYSARAPPLS